MIKNIIKSLFVCSVFLAFIGCEEEIQLPLADESGKIVIEGAVDDAPGPYYVRITKSTKITQIGSGDLSTGYPVVKNAQVILKDNNGQTENLIYYQDGYYITQHFTTKPGDIYTLSVKVDGKEYMATSQMPKKVNLDDLSYKKVSDQYLDRYLILPVYTDPAEKGNYYKFKLTTRRISWVDVILDNDDIGNGQVNTRYISPVINYSKNDTINVEMQCIDKPVFNYFRALPNVQLNGDPTGVPPANPVSNISNGALGYFSAYTSDEKQIIIQ
ncbi:DUF4249 domain-containing protein [Chryseobacterium daeguense]|uniref:DUF4249 domain-containing protein n=1 Tax=Chryseobacterium daeguense TaxID=412438 RepID=UPI0004168053|nr:DUF4249 domain-containing protein [Chryseobacterium daeguense]